MQSQRGVSLAKRAAMRNRFTPRQLAGDGPRENNVHASGHYDRRSGHELLEVSFSAVVTGEPSPAGCDKTDGAMRISPVHAQRFARLIKYPDCRFILPKPCNLT